MKIRWSALAMVLGAGLLSGCALLPAEEEGRSIALVAEQEAPQYSVEKVTYRDVQHTELLYANYNRMGNQDYSFETGGTLKQVYVSNGDSVEKGQLLAVLDTYEAAKLAADQYTAQIEQLEASQEALQSEMEFQKRRVEILYRYGELTQQQYQEQFNEIARNYDLPLQEIADTLYIDQLRLEEANEQMDQGAIYAEGDGMVTFVHNISKASNDMYDSFRNMYGQQEAEKTIQQMISRANTVTAADTIVSVADLESCAFVCETTYTDCFSLGESVSLSVGSDTTYSVKVSEIGDGVIYFQLSEKSQTVDVGTVGRYTLVLEEQSHALSISVTSLHETEDGYYVYYVDDAGLRQIKEVEVGVVGNVYAQITGGLSEGDLVIKR